MQDDNSMGCSTLEGMTQGEIQRMIVSVKTEGATDADIQRWWNMSQGERDSITQLSYSQRQAAFMHFCLDLKMIPFPDAFRKVAESCVVYTEYPLEPAYSTELQKNGLGPEDYALPWELYYRIGNYGLQMVSHGKENFQQRIKEFSSFNAFLRHKIRSGEI